MGTWWCLAIIRTTLTAGEPVMTALLEQAFTFAQTAAHDRIDDELELGRLLVAAREENPDLDVAGFSRLVGLSPSRVYRATRVLELCTRVGCDWPGLTPSHLRAVFPVPPELQRELLERAEAEAWPVRKLVQEAERTPQLLRTRGRPRVSPALKTIRELHRLATESGAFEGADALTRMSSREMRKILADVDRLAAELAALQSLLRRPGSRGPRPSEPARMRAVGSQQA